MTERAVKLVTLPQYFCENSSNVVICKSNLGGRGLFATKFIEKGSLIFINEPVVYGPRANCDTKSFCSICYKLSDLCYPCEKCNVLVCSDNCRNLYDHTELCRFIHENFRLKSNSYTAVEVSVILARVLIYIRFLLLSEEQKDLLRMFQVKESNTQFEDLIMLKSIYFIPENQVEFIQMTESIMKINSFRISHCQNSGRIELRGLYPLSAFLNHSCVPNTTNVFKVDYSKAVYSTRDIEKGEEITSCYTGILWCSPARRCQLYKTKHFWCQCIRCNDNTEMGTKLSALKCLNANCIGILLPKYPLNTQTKWHCDTCNNAVASEKINTIQSVLGSLVGTLKLDTEFRLENKILKRLAMFIPYSNHILVDVRLRLALKLGFIDGDIIKGIIKRKANLTN